MFGLIFPKWPFMAVPAILSGVLVGWLALTLHNASVTKLEADHKDALDKLTIEMHESCQRDKKLTLEASRDFQKKISSLNSKLADAKRMFNGSRPQCVVTLGNTGGPNGTTIQGKLSRPNGVSVDWLLEFAAEAEHCRQQLIGLQSFVKKTDPTWFGQ